MSDKSSEAPDFITFTARGGHGEYTVRLREPVPLFDEGSHGYRTCRAIARRHIRRQLGMHPCARLVVEPYDWSDGVDRLTDANEILRAIAESIEVSA